MSPDRLGDPDDEYPTSPPRPTSPAPAPPPTPAGPATRSFGDVGTTTFAQLSGLMVSEGLMRTVSAAYTYHTPPLSHPWVRATWVDVSGDRRSFQLALSHDESRRAVSLEEWATHLRTAPPYGETPDATLARDHLTNFARTFLDALDQLHQAGWRIGLTHPRNLYVVRDVDRTTTVLWPDLGFVWQGTGPPPWRDDPTKPSHLDGSAPHANLYAPVEPALQQLAQPNGWRVATQFRSVASIDGSTFPDAVRRADVQIAARLFAFLLTGEFTPPPSRLRHDLRQVLSDAIAGKYPDAQSLRTALNAVPLGCQYSPEVEPPHDAGSGTGSKTKPVWAIAVGLAAVATVVGGIVLWSSSRTDSPDTGKPHAGVSGETHATTPDGGGDTSGGGGPDPMAVEAARTWRTDFETAYTQASATGADPLDTQDRLRKLTDQLDSLLAKYPGSPPAEEMKQWRDFCRSLGY